MFKMRRTLPFSVATVTVIGWVYLLMLTSLGINVSAYGAWQRPGCHRLGHERTVNITGCVKFKVTTNACRGYCLSYSHPSPPATREKNPNHLFTSKAECCGIAETHDVIVKVWCLNPMTGVSGYRTFTFKSARTCSCSVCQYV